MQFLPLCHPKYANPFAGGAPKAPSLHIGFMMRTNIPTQPPFGDYLPPFMMVGQRRRLLNYLSKKDIERYRSVVSRLGLRR